MANPKKIYKIQALKGKQPLVELSKEQFKAYQEKGLLDPKRYLYKVLVGPSELSKEAEKIVKENDAVIDTEAPEAEAPEVKEDKPKNTRKRKKQNDK